MKKLLALSALLIFALNSAFSLAQEQGPVLVAAVEAEGAYLYTVGKNQLRLKYQNKISTFNWIYDESGYNPPQMRVFDYDGDGQKEIAIVLGIGTGTGLNLSELHIVKIENNKMIAYSYSAEDYLKQIKTTASLCKEKKDGRLFATFTTPGNAFSVDMTPYLSLNPTPEPELELEYGDIISFTLQDNGSINFEAALGVMASAPQTLDYLVDFIACVAFDGQRFSLTEISLRVDL